MHHLNAGELRIEVEQNSAGTIQLHWTGKSNDREPRRVLQPFFAAVMAAAEEKHATIEMHFERLGFFNSSTISALVHLIQDLRNRQITLVIVFDAKTKWQKLSFDAMRVFVKSDGLLQMRSV